MVQESRETLFRLQRMAGFESQNFDPQVVCHLPVTPCMWSLTEAMSCHSAYSRVSITCVHMACTYQACSFWRHAVMAWESRKMHAQLKLILSLQDNDLEREFQVHRTESDYALAEFWKWVIACMIGLSMGCIGFAVDWGITLLHDAKYQSTASVLKSTGTFADDIDTQHLVEGCHNMCFLHGVLQWTAFGF